MRKLYHASYILATLLPALAGSTTTQQVLGDVGQCDRPNVVFILTDDQDAHLGWLEYMPFVRKHLLNEGTYFNKHYCTTAVCCPSRATLWTGKASHNTNITDVNPPYG
jgi:arylsulfatase A-like enzyme